MTQSHEDNGSDVARFTWDDYANVVTALGTAVDKSTHTTFVGRPDLTNLELDDIYEKSALSARVVDRIVDDATREGFTVVGKDPSYDYDALSKRHKSMGTMLAAGDTWRWARLYGGALLMPVVNTATKMNVPLDLTTATKIKAFQVIEKPFAQPQGFRTGLGARSFRAPVSYAVTSSAGGAITTVHHTRVLRMDGMRVPPSRLISRQGWAPSVLDRSWPSLSALGTAMGYSKAILHELSVMVLKLKGFRAAAVSSGKSKAELRKAVATIRYFIDNLHTLAIDSEDEYVETSRSVAGLDALVNQFVDAAVRDTDMPRTILLGEQPHGLNANAESEIAAWYSFVDAEREKKLTPVLSEVVRWDIELQSRAGVTPPTDWTIEYPELRRPTENEEADIDLKRMQADQLRFAMGQMDGLELLRWRAGLGQGPPVPERLQLEEAGVGT